MTEKQKILLFYALAALERTLTTDENGDLYYKQNEYYPEIHELERLGNEAQLKALIEKTLDQLC